nr:hypothetical protein [Chloroflexaceae bacterium]
RLLRQRQSNLLGAVVLESEAPAQGETWFRFSQLPFAPTMPLLGPGRTTTETAPAGSATADGRVIITPDYQEQHERSETSTPAAIVSEPAI